MTARTSTKPPEPDPVPDDDAPTILVLSSKDPVPERNKVPLFSLDGKTYTVDKPQPPNRGLRYLHLMHTQGTQVAYAYMLETMLGPEGYAVLMGYDNLQPEHLERLIQDAMKILLGSQDAPKGQQRKARRRTSG